MNSKNPLMRETLTVAAGQLLGCAVMIGIFVLMDKFDTSVLLGAAVGAVLATANYFLMALLAGIAADKAMQQDVKGGQTLVHLSYMGRMIGLFLILALCAKSGKCNVIALVVPLIFVRPTLTIAELLSKKGGQAV